MTQTIATSLTLFVYLFLASSYYGWGQLASLLLGINNQKRESAVMPIWLGWVFTLLIFQMLHFFLPITAYVSVPVLVIGAVFCISQIRNKLRRYPIHKSALLFIVIILAIVLITWVASKAMLDPVNYDSGLYHFNSIRWINTHPIIPGLGNLQGRLAFNQSFFVYVAALNFYPFFGYGRSLANSFLLLLVLATVLPSIITILKHPALLVKEHPFRYASDLFILPVCAYLALSSDGIASPSPDLSSTLLQLAMFVMLAHGIALWVNGQKDQNYQVMVLVVLAATAVTIKLSNLAFSAVIICFALAYTWQTSRSHVKSIFHILLPVIILFLVWTLRGYILSGVPLFPSTIRYLPVEWAMPINQINSEAEWVLSWARLPGAYPKDVLGNWSWLHPWFFRVFQDITNVVYPSILTVLFFGLTLIICLLKKASRPHYLEWAILLPPVIALFFWFFSAPDPRFAHANIYLALICSILLFFSSIQKNNLGWIYNTTICVALLVGNLQYIPYAFNYNNLVVSTSG